MRYVWEGVAYCDCHTCIAVKEFLDKKEDILKILSKKLDTYQAMCYHILVTKQKPLASHLAANARQGWI